MMNESLIKALHAHYPDVTIVMASKYIEAEALGPFIDAGITNFGESRVEAFIEKAPILSQYPITKHFLGPVQSKKVKKLADHIDVLHSLDRLKVAKLFNKHQTKPLKVFVQVNISNEPQKHGLDIKAVPAFLTELKALDKLEVIGLMGMATHTSNHSQIESEFAQLKQLQASLIDAHPSLQYLSMGMSNDYELALKHGATHLRLGRVLLKEDERG